MKAKHILYAFLGLFTVAVSSCSDFFDTDSDHVTFTDDKHINEAGDSIYSLTGILQKLQALGDRTILLGEARGDLVSVTDAASSDLRDVANFNVNDSNKYNNPRDYYAVINNCNFYIQKCDTTLKNSYGEGVFMREYAAVKAIRAWTYLQLAINYGHVPFVTEPILTKEQADATYPTQDIQGICDYFLKDLQTLTNVERPGLGTIGSYDSRFLYFPVYLVMGDLNLWKGNYKEAAYCYYRYLATANGSNSVFPIGRNYVHWGNSSWSRLTYSGSVSRFAETWNKSRELITIIPGDSLPSQGNYSELRSIYNTSADNNYEASLTPSMSLRNLSAEQSNNYITSDKDIIYTPTGLDDDRDGDLRLMDCWSHSNNRRIGDRRINYQYISKFSTRNIHIYRKTMVYLRLAEALNRAGYPHFAYQILARGVNNSVIADYVLPYCTTATDSAFVNMFSFPGTYTSTSDNNYIVFDIDNMDNLNNVNTIGIHSRGSGWACYNKNYAFPDDSTLVGDVRKQYQIEKMEDMIVDEDALELAFEGSRYYDLLRVALRRNDPSYVANKVKARNGAGTIDSGISKSLLDWKDLFLSWQGKIGY